jgi:hypothetical protein
MREGGRNTRACWNLKELWSTAERRSPDRPCRRRCRHDGVITGNNGLSVGSHIAVAVTTSYWLFAVTISEVNSSMGAPDVRDGGQLDLAADLIVAGVDRNNDQLSLLGVGRAVGVVDVVLADAVAGADAGAAGMYTTVSSAGS